MKLVSHTICCQKLRVLYFNLFGIEYYLLRGAADFRVDFDNTGVSPRFTEL